MQKEEKSIEPSFLKTSKKEHEYVPGTIFVSRNLFWFAYVEIAGVEQAYLTSSKYVSPSYISTNHAFLKHKGFIVKPGEPIFLVDKRISIVGKACHECWQVISVEKIGWIGVSNLGEFRHYNVNKNYKKALY